MSKKLIKYLSVGLGILLVMGLIGSFALAAKKKELTPFEFNQLAPKEKLAYRTIEIAPPWWPPDWGREGEEEAKALTKMYTPAQQIEQGMMEVGYQWWSTALFLLEHPRIKFIAAGRAGAGGAGAEAKLMADIAAGKGPAWYDPGNFGGTGAVIEKGMAADMTEVMKTWKRTPKLRKEAWSMWEQMWKDGRCYGFIMNIDPQGVIFNQDRFKEIGIFNQRGNPGPPDNWTISEFREIAKKLTNVKEKHWGFAFAGNDMPTGSIFTAFCAANGVLNPYNLVVPDKSGKCTWRMIATPALVRSVQLLRDMKWEDKSLLNDPTGYCWSTLMKEVLGDPATARSGMGFGSIGGYFAFVLPRTTADGVPYRDKYGMVPMPLGKSSIRPYIMMNNQWVFNPSYNYDQLKATLEWFDWHHWGRGKQLELEYKMDRAKLFNNPSLMTECGDLRKIGYDEPPKPKGYPPKSELYREDVLRNIDIMNSAPVPPLGIAYGFNKINTYGAPGQYNKVTNPCLQVVLTNANADVVKEIEKAANIANKTIYNYKVKNDLEKLKEYYAALDEFFKKNYPEWAKSKEYEEELSYNKFW